MGGEELVIIFAIIVLLIIFLWLLCPQEGIIFTRNVNKILLEQTDDEEKMISSNSENHLNDGRVDERAFEVGDSEIERPVIDIDQRQYYQNLGDKLKQDEAIEMLLRATERKQTKKLNFENTKAGEQAKQRQIDKEKHNERMLDKLRGYRIKRKIAKKIAKKNIQLDEKMIEKIKRRALAGKMR